MAVDLWNIVNAEILAQRAGIDVAVAQAAIDSHWFVMECMEAAGCVVAHYTGFVLGPYDSAERRFVRDDLLHLLDSWPSDVDFSDHVSAQLSWRGATSCSSCR